MRGKMSNIQRIYEKEQQEKINTNSGITLIALVVTIVVLLILAGITINFIVNGNSVLSQALDARVQNKLGEIQDQARIIYSDLLIKKFKGDNDKISLIDIVTELRKQRYEIEAREVAADAVKGITASPSELILNKNETGKITIKYDGSDDGYLYYAKVEGKYYKIKMDETTLEVEREASNPEGTAATATLEVESGYNTNIVANAQINGNEIIITAGNTEGNITLTIKYGEELTTTCEVKVAPKVTKITLNKGTADMVEGEEIRLTATVEPEYALNKEVTWRSSDETIATVDQTGKVTGVREGTAKITATAKDGSLQKAECSVTVLQKISDWEYLNRVAIAIAKDSLITENSTRASGKTSEGEDYDIEIGNDEKSIFKIGYTPDPTKPKETVVKQVRVIGFKHDELVDKSVYGSGVNQTNASITFDFVDFMTGTKYMKMNEEDSNDGGWGSSQMRKDLNGYTTTADAQSGTIGGLGANLSNSGVIKQVKKQYIKQYNDANSNNYTQDYLWMLSCAEIVQDGYKSGTSGYAIAKEGSQYPYYKVKKLKYNEKNPILLKKGDSGASDYTWCLRSPRYDSDYKFCSVFMGRMTNGNSDATSYLGVSPGFCI